MGLDSLELVLAWEEAFDISLETEAQVMLTPRQVFEGIFAKVKSDLPSDHGCLAVRGFYRLRTAFVAKGVERQRVRLDTKVATLLPARRPRDVLSAVLERAGLTRARRLPFGLQFTFGDVRGLVMDAVGQPHRLRLPGHGWSRRQVREVVRAIISNQLGLSEFSDDAEFVKDLGIG